MNKPINIYIKTINKTSRFQACPNLANSYPRFKYTQNFASMTSEVGKDNIEGSFF